MRDELRLVLSDGRVLILWIDDDGRLHFETRDFADEAAIGADGVVHDPAMTQILAGWLRERERPRRDTPLTLPHEKSDTVPIWVPHIRVVAGQQVVIGNVIYEVGEEAQAGDVLYLIGGKLGHWPK